MTLERIEEDDLVYKRRQEQTQTSVTVEEEAANAIRRGRFKRLAATTTAVAVAVIVLIITGGSNGSSPPPLHSTQAAAIDREINTLLAGIPQNANVLGSPAAPVTLQWFGDLECPFCREFTLGALPTLIRKWVRTGQLKIVYRSIQTATHNPKIFKIQQTAALAAGEQNKMWNFIEIFYHEQGRENSGYVTEEYLQIITQQIPGFYPTQWAADRTNPEFESQLTTDNQLAQAEGFVGTPSFLIGRAGEKLLPLQYNSLTDPTILTKQSDH